MSESRGGQIESKLDVFMFLEKDGARAGGEISKPHFDEKMRMLYPLPAIRPRSQVLENVYARAAALST